MEQGTGKTRVAILKAYSLYSKGLIDRVLIISPNGVKDQWITEQFHLHYPNKEWAGMVWNGLSTIKSRLMFDDLLKFDGLKVWSVNIDAFQASAIDEYIRMYCNKQKLYIIIDESTRIKNGRRKTKGSKRAGAKSTNKILDIFESVKYKSILTGTPTPNNPFDLWSQFEFLKKDFFGMDFFFFQHHYGIMIKRSIGGGRMFNSILDEKMFSMIKSGLKKFTNLKPVDLETIAQQYSIKVSDVMKIHTSTVYSPYKNLEELRDKISSITFFVKKKDCLDLPDKVYEKLFITMGREQKTIYDTLKKEMYATYGDREISITTKMVMALRLQMVTGGLFPYSDTTIKIMEDGEEFFDTNFKYETIKDNQKIITLLDDLEEVQNDTSIIVWARFTGEIEMIHNALINQGYTAEQYRGGSHISIVDRFKNKGFQILVSNPLKGGEGLNLQVATLQYFYSNSFMADKRLQAEDRSHRIGQTNKVLYKDLICKNTVDERVYEVLKRKENLIDFFRGKVLEDILG
jgi:SNF2 family DNA or RNA helicase